jgi:hypothetical protein
MNKSNTLSVFCMNLYQIAYLTIIFLCNTSHIFARTHKKLKRKSDTDKKKEYLCKQKTINA